MWRVQIENALNEHGTFAGANEIALISGCHIAAARKLMRSLPTLPQPLYQHQAQHLIRELSKVQVLARLILLNNTHSN